MLQQLPLHPQQQQASAVESMTVSVIETKLSDDEVHIGEEEVDDWGSFEHETSEQIVRK